MIPSTAYLAEAIAVTFTMLPASPPLVLPFIVITSLLAPEIKVFPVASVTPDKSAIMFKIFCTDEAALHKFIEGTEVSKPVMDEVLGSYTIYDLTKVKEG